MPSTKVEDKPQASMRSPELLSLCTIRIVGETDSGASVVGTGFFFRFEMANNMMMPLIVTNRHVVEGVTKQALRFTRTHDDKSPAIGSTINVESSQFGAKWMPHPDPEVDLCVLPIGKLLNTVSEQGIKLWVTYVDSSFVTGPEAMAELTAGEQVVMVGYPVGLFDSVHNMPVFRQGIAATHPRYDYEARKEFLVDIACFEGSSGSPVFLWGIPLTEKPNTIFTGGRVTRGLLGVLYAGHYWTTEGKIKKRPIPSRTESVPMTRMPINLGYVIKAERLLEFRELVLPRAEDSEQLASEGVSDT